MRGGNGDDVMYGGTGDDRMSGNSDNDVIIGGEGNDKMQGGSGNDIMIGGDGVDQVSGNSGSDVFVADLTSANGGQMTVRDFKLGEDALYLNTGDVLTADELFTIFSAGATQTGKHIEFDNGEGDILTILSTDLDDISANDFYDIDTDADDGTEDLLLGFL